ncbi:polyprenol monophosphomannose synthase [Leifsonia sp. SIMBA_070]|uniref:polyprenol monophosphomannose synthase n=1 Tax=Leifsonia sp. SIMBA_070 TaxID=3085810 RepID=UPI003979724A
MRALIVMPTFNERENLAGMATRIRAATPEVHVLVVDDASPDGTGELADRIALDEGSVHVLHRTGKSGLGAAYRAGMRWGLDRGYDVIVAMDADGSHQPEQLPRLLDAIADADVVVGSRWVDGGSIVNWPTRRRLLSKGGSLYAGLALGIPAKDVTGGYRAYRADAVQRIHLEGVVSRGYCFQIDMLRRAYSAGQRVVEVPITFVERELGASKMTGGIVVEAMLRVTGWGLAGIPRRLLRRRRALSTTPSTAPATTETTSESR